MKKAPIRCGIYIYTHRGILLSCKKIKRMKNLPFAETWIDLKVIIVRKINQANKSKYCMLSHTCGI